MLTQADTAIFPMYADLRTQFIMMAAEFAQAHRLLVSIVVRSNAHSG